MEKGNNLEELQERGTICLKDLQDLLPRLFLEHTMEGKIVAYSKDKDEFHIDVESFDVEVDITDGIIEGILGHHYEDTSAEREDAFLIAKDIDESLIIQNIDGAEEKIAWMKFHLPFEK